MPFTRRQFVQSVSALTAALGLPISSSRAAIPTARVEAESAFDRMTQLRLAYMQAAGDSQKRYAINREIVALAFEMRDQGASRQHIMAIGQMSLHHAKSAFAV